MRIFAQTQHQVLGQTCVYCTMTLGIFSYLLLIMWNVDSPLNWLITLWTPYYSCDMYTDMFSPLIVGFNMHNEVDDYCCMCSCSMLWSAYCTFMNIMFSRGHICHTCFLLILHVDIHLHMTDLVHNIEHIGTWPQHMYGWWSFEYGDPWTRNARFITSYRGIWWSIQDGGDDLVESPNPPLRGRNLDVWPRWVQLASPGKCWVHNKRINQQR